MRLFPIPFVIQQEEKIFGGYFSLRQAIYIFFAFLSLGIFFTAIPLILRIIIFALIVSALMSLAFIRIYGYNLDTFLIILLKYAFRKKKMPYSR